MNLDLFKSITTYSVFIISTGAVIAGLLIGNSRMVDIFLPILSASVGFYLGGKF
jgi:hypothetical protein